MTVIVIAMIMILGLAALVAGLVVMGIEGRGKSRAPKLAEELTRYARHLNGEARPPKRLTRLLQHSLSR